MLKKRFEVEIKYSQKMIVEVDPETFEAMKPDTLQAPNNELDDHVAEIANIFATKKRPGVFGQYGLVSVDGESGGRMMVQSYPHSGVNIFPLTGNTIKKKIQVDEIESVKRAREVIAKS